MPPYTTRSTRSATRALRRFAGLLHGTNHGENVPFVTLLSNSGLLVFNRFIVSLEIVTCSNNDPFITNHDIFFPAEFTVMLKQK